MFLFLAQGSILSLGGNNPAERSVTAPVMGRRTAKRKTGKTGCEIGKRRARHAASPPHLLFSFFSSAPSASRLERRFCFPGRCVPRAPAPPSRPSPGNNAGANLHCPMLLTQASYLSAQSGWIGGHITGDWSSTDSTEAFVRDSLDRDCEDCIA